MDLQHIKTSWQDGFGANRSLSVRLLILLSLALLPIGLIAIQQTVTILRDVDELKRRDILSRTLEAANEELGLIRRAAGLAQVMGTAAKDFGEDDAACARFARLLVEEEPSLAFAGFIGGDGVLACGSTGVVHDFAGSEGWKTMVVDPQPRIGVSRRGALSGRSVLIVSEPVLADDGALIGLASVSLPHSLFDESYRGDRAPIVDVGLVDDRSRVLAASSGLDSERFTELAKRVQDMSVPLHGEVVNIALDNGIEPVAIVPLPPYNVNVLGRWLPGSAPDAPLLANAGTIMLPLVMWLTSLLVAFFAMQSQVLRHVRELVAKMASFSADDVPGSYLKLSRAPNEMNAISRSYNALLDRISENTEALQETVEEKEILLKEVHHRVKNNLQLIASILNMQLRELGPSDASDALHRLQDRVMSLAAIHELLYGDEVVDRVRIDLLLTEILENVLRLGSESEALRCDFILEPVELVSDQAVPLALLLTEAVTNALKHIYTASIAHAELRITLREDADQRVTLIVINTAKNLPERPKNDRPGLGRRLIEAFALQLEGAHSETLGNGVYELRVSFPKTFGGRDAAPTR